MVAFEDFTFQKLVSNQLFGLELCAVRQGIFYPHQCKNELISTKSRVFFSLVGPSESGKWKLTYNCLKNGTFEPKFDKNYFSYQHSQLLYDVMQNEIGNFEFVEVVNFEFIDSLKRKTWKQRRNILLSEKRLQLIAVIKPPVINHLYRFGAVCPCPSFCV